MRSGLILILMHIMSGINLSSRDFKEIRSYYSSKYKKYDSDIKKYFHKNQDIQNQYVLKQSRYYNKTIPRSDKGSRESYIGKEIRAQNKRKKIKKDLSKKIK